MNKKHVLWMAASFVGIVGSIYWRALSLPFVADDWWYVRQFQTVETAQLVRYFFDPSDKVVYRPLGEAAMALTYLLVGFNPAPMHWAGLLLHVVNSCLVVFILTKVLQNKVVAYLTGAVYASAIAIHLDIFVWAWATYYDFGATFFFLLSILLYLNNRPWLSAFSYLIVCLFKPLGILLPVLFVLHWILFAQPKTADVFSRRALYRWFPFLVFGGLVAWIKFFGSSAIGFGEDSAYGMDLWGRHLLTNASRYSNWMFQAVFPFYIPKTQPYVFIAWGTWLLCLTGAFFALLAVRKDPAFRRMVLLFGWLVVGLLPPYLLPNHSYRYYAIYSLPAYIALLYYSIQYLLEKLNVGQRVNIVVIILLGLLAVGGSFIQSTRIFDEKLHQSTFADGTNMLIRRAETQTLVSERLRRDFQSLPPGLVIVLINTDLGAFGVDNLVLQAQFGSNEFEILPPSAISYESGDWFFTTPDSAPQYLDPSLAVVYELTDTDIVRRDLVDLLQPSTTP